MTVYGGGSAPAAVVLTNHGSTAAQLVLNNACRLANVEMGFLDTHGERVDLDGRGQCDRGSFGGAEYLAIELPPGGVARIPFAMDAAS